MSEADSTDGGDRSAALAGASNVLVLSPEDAATDGLCHELLTGVDLGRTDVLLATYTKTPDRLVREWANRTARRPAKMKIISVGDGTRSMAAGGSAPAGAPTASLVETVSSPADLTGLGIKLSEQLQAWNGDGNEVVLCFHSLSELLDAVDTQTAFRFLHVVTGRFDSIGATAHYHLDPARFDERTVNTIKALFDAAVERVDGEWVVRSR